MPPGACPEHGEGVSMTLCFGAVRCIRHCTTMKNSVIVTGGNYLADCVASCAVFARIRSEQRGACVVAWREGNFHCPRQTLLSRLSRCFAAFTVQSLPSQQCGANRCSGSALIPICYHSHREHRGRRVDTRERAAVALVAPISVDCCFDGTFGIR
jgi:hypothetical protein